MNYQAYVSAINGRQKTLAGELARFKGVSDVLDWMQSTKRTQATVDIIGQDEFHYDFLIELKPGGDWLAFGIT